MGSKVRTGERVSAFVQLTVNFWFDVGVGVNEEWWIVLVDSLNCETAVQSELKLLQHFPLSRKT